MENEEQNEIIRNALVEYESEDNKWQITINKLIEIIQKTINDN